MALSLLYLEHRSSDAEPIGEKVLYHLSLDRTFSYICTDQKRRTQFFSVLSSLTNDRDEIRYRQEILKDFQLKQNLLYTQ